MEGALHGIQPLRNPRGASQTPEHGIVLYALLHMHLDTALPFANLEGHFPQAVRDELAKHKGQRRQEDKGPGEPRVKPAEHQECPQKLYRRHHHLGNFRRSHFAYQLHVLGKTEGHVARKEFLFAVELTGKQPPEHGEPKRVGLPDGSHRREVVIHLTEHHVPHHRKHQQAHHAGHVLVRTVLDGIVDKAFAQPHHGKAEGNLQGSHRHAKRHIQANSADTLP